MKCGYILCLEGYFDVVIWEMHFMTSTWNCTLNAQINLQHKKLKTGQETNISNMSWKFVKKDMTIILTILLHFVSTNALLAITIIFILTGKVFSILNAKILFLLHQYSIPLISKYWLFRQHFHLTMDDETFLF